MFTVTQALFYIYNTRCPQGMDILSRKKRMRDNDNILEIITKPQKYRHKIYEADVGNVVKISTVVSNASTGPLQRL